MKNQFKKFCITSVVVLFIAISFYASQAEARSGCCSWHGGVCGCRCCDGSSLSAKCAPYYPSCSYIPSPTPTLPKKYDCSKYGTFAYSDGSGYCECMSGYIWDTNILGDKTCVSCSSKYGYGSTYDYLNNSCKCRSSYVWGTDILGKRKCVLGNQECKDQYGYGSTYDSLSGKCKCSYGYIWGTDILGKDKCVSESQYCRDKYGYNSKYNSLSDKCECKSGYELTIKTYGSGLECKSCSLKYGFHSSYDYLSKKCECDDGYISNDNNQCVKKQNNKNYNFSLNLEKNIYIPYSPPAVKGVTDIIPEGALIKTTNGIDIYIVKYVGSKKFKRLILSPSVFNNYGHLRWEDVMDVSQVMFDEFTTSELVRAVGDDKTYRLYAQGDTGQKRMIKNNSVLTRLGFDLDSVYEINSFDRNSYITGSILE